MIVKDRNTDWDFTDSKIFQFIISIIQLIIIRVFDARRE